MLLSDAKDIFGTITPPDAIKPFTDKGGSGGISFFLNNLIALIYIVAGIVFVFMILWGAFEWLTSGGEKEKIQNAQKRLTNALIGIILFGIAFAIINVLGIFTGFTFYSSVSNKNCPADQYYSDTNTNQCIHKFYDGAACTIVFRPVEKRFCP